MLDEGERKTAQAKKLAKDAVQLFPSSSNVESKFEHLLNELETSDISTVSLAIRLL